MTSGPETGTGGKMFDDETKDKSISSEASKKRPNVSHIHTKASTSEAHVVLEKGPKRKKLKIHGTSVSNEDARSKLQTARRELPIYKAKSQIIDALKSNDTLVLVGETGFQSFPCARPE